MTLHLFPNPLRWKFVRRGGIFLACCLGLCAFADNWLPYALISHHNVAVTRTPSPDSELLQVTAPDGTVTAGWWIPAPVTPLEVLPRGTGDETAMAEAMDAAIAQAPAPLTLILLHGLGGSRQDLLDFGLALQQDAAALGIPLSLAAMDLRSHGDSQGPYFTYGYHEGKDISALLDALEAQLAAPGDAVASSNAPSPLTPDSSPLSPLQQAPEQNYAILGVSAGGAVAIAAAAQDDRLQALITLGTFADLRATATSQTEILPEVWRDRVFRRAEAIAQFELAQAAPAYQMAQVSVPVLIAHGRQDGYIPFANAEQLYAAARSPKQLYSMDADHADMISSGGDALRQEIIQFLQAIVQP